MLASCASVKRTAGKVRPSGRRLRLAVGCSIRSNFSLPVRMLPLAISLLLRNETKSDSTRVASLTEELPGLDPLEEGREDHLRGRQALGPYCTLPQSHKQVPVMRICLIADMWPHDAIERRLASNHACQMQGRPTGYFISKHVHVCMKFQKSCTREHARPEPF